MVTDEEMLRMMKGLAGRHGTQLGSIACLLGLLAVMLKSGHITQRTHECHTATIWMLLQPWMKETGVTLDQLKEACEEVTRINRTIAFMNSIPD